MKKILLVHEAKLFLRMEQTALLRRDYQIYTASTGYRALQTAREKRPELVIFDATLSDMDGTEICREIRKDPGTRHTSLLVVLREGTDAEIEKFLRAGANDCIARPVKRMELNQRVSSLLNIPARRFLRTLVKVEVEGKGKKGRFFGRTVNLSSGGMLLETSEEIEKGQSVEVQFLLPGDEDPTRLQGEVVRTAQEMPPGARGYGIRFVEAPESVRKKIDAFIQELDGRHEQ